jgi:tetratricopeptide (TPR) repeat protein
MRGLSLAYILMAVLLLARIAGADAVSAAKEHYARGSTLFDLGRFDDAAKEFEAAYEAKNDPALLFNIGQSYRSAGNYSKALVAYRAYLRRTPNAPNRRQVESNIAELQDLVDKQKSAGARPPEGTLPPGQEPQEQPTATPPAPAPTPPAPTPPPPPPARKHSIGFLVGGAVLLAAGVAGIAVGADDVAINGSGTCTLPAGQAQCPQRYNTAGVGGAFIGIGIAALAGGAALIALDIKRTRAPLHAGVRVAPGLAALVAEGRF